MAAHLIVLTKPKGLAWVLQESHLGWRRAAVGAAKYLEPGDEVFLYAGRGIISSSWQGSIIGEARVCTRVSETDEPIRVEGLLIEAVCVIDLVALVAPSNAIPLRPLVPELAVFRFHVNPRAWQGHLQRGCIGLNAQEARLIRERFPPASSGVEELKVRQYLDRLGKARPDEP